MTVLSQTAGSSASGRVLLAAGAAIVSLVAALVLDVGSYLGLVALLVVVALALLGIGLQSARPVAGLGLLIASGVAFPVEFRGPAGVMMGSSFGLSAALCGAWMLRLVLMPAASPLPRSRVVYAAFAFMGACVLSFVVGLVPLFPSGGAPVPAQVAQLGIFLISGCLLLAVGQQITSVAQLRTITWLLVGVGTITCLLQMIPALGAVARVTTRPGSVGSLFWTWLVAISASQALFNRRLAAPLRLALLGVTALVLGHGLIQVRSWASGWLPPLVSLGMLVLLRLPRLTIGLGLVALPLGALVATQLSSTLLADESYSVMTRQEAWRVLWNLVERNPLFGTGPANYYYYTENFPILGWYVRFISHNNYQDLLVQTGFVGLLVFAWLAWESGWLAFATYRGTATSGFEKAYAAGALSGLAGSLASGMLGDWFLPFYYNAGLLGFRSSMLLWVFLGGLLAMQRIAREDAQFEERAALSRAREDWR